MCCCGADAAVVFGVPIVVVRWADGDIEAGPVALEVAVAGGASPPKPGRSWGAGEGAIAIAALMLGEIAARKRYSGDNRA